MRFGKRLYMQENMWSSGSATTGGRPVPPASTCGTCGNRADPVTLSGWWGGGPAATQTSEFLDSLDKNSWCCLGCFVQFGKICVICCDRVSPPKQACLMIGLLSNSWENTSSCYLALVVLTSLMFQLYWYLWCIRTYMHMKWKPSRVYWSWNAVNCIKLLHISMRTRHGALI